MSKPLILVTNDDGYKAGGIKALTEALMPFADIVVVAPVTSCSGMSSAITVKVPIRLKIVKDQPSLKIIKVAGTPVDCVKIALNQILERKPDLLVSGINHGLNTSVSVHYSGTMGAALEGCINGVPSLGVSLDDYSCDADFTHAAELAAKGALKVIEYGIPQGVCLNMNVPKGKYVKGIRECRMAGGNWVEEFEKRTDPHGGIYYWLTGYFKDHEPESEDTDEWAIRNGFASLVPCKVDVTEHTFVKKLKEWSL